MDVCDLRMFQRCEQSCEELDLILKAQSTFFVLETSEGDHLGSFQSVAELFYYLLGFKCGKSLNTAIMEN